MKQKLNKLTNMLDGNSSDNPKMTLSEAKDRLRQLDPQFNISSALVEINQSKYKNSLVLFIFDNILLPSIHKILKK